MFRTIFLNNKLLTLTNNTALPEIRPKVLNDTKGVDLQLQSGDIGFWVVPDLKVTKHAPFIFFSLLKFFTSVFSVIKEIYDKNTNYHRHTTNVSTAICLKISNVESVEAVQDLRKQTFTDQCTDTCLF